MSSSLTAQNARIFRITHIDNVPWVLRNGLHCRNSGLFDANFVNIGNPELIEKRNHRDVPLEPWGTLSDYIPFYFTPFSPMLFNIKTGYGGIKKRENREIVIFASSFPKLHAEGVRFVFSDRHAYLATAQYFSDTKDLMRIDWRLLQARDFKRDPDDPGKFERYQAEALAHQSVPVNALSGIVCYNDSASEQLKKYMRDADVSLPVAARPSWYFK